MVGSSVGGGVGADDGFGLGLGGTGHIAQRFRIETEVVGNLLGLGDGIIA